MPVKWYITWFYAVSNIFIYTQCGIFSFLFVFQGDWGRLLVITATRRGGGEICVKGEEIEGEIYKYTYSSSSLEDES